MCDSRALERFREIIDEARSTTDLAEPAAATLATCDAAGYVTARIVLIRAFDERGFTFYTNSESVKGRQIAAHPRAALCCYWDALGKQVRIEGRVEIVDKEESDAYWSSRPRSSQLSAWASRQSSPLGSRGALEQEVADVALRFEGRPIPRPDHWFGYRVVPERIEFWTRGEARMHERLVFEASATGWTESYLYP